MFHYFHEGRVFPIESKGDSQPSGSTIDLEGSGRPRLQYFWLCSCCCQLMKVQGDGKGGFKLVTKRRVLPVVRWFHEKGMLEAPGLSPESIFDGTFQGVRR
jgi:hypothetical protein